MNGIIWLSIGVVSTIWIIYDGATAGPTTPEGAGYNFPPLPCAVMCGVVLLPISVFPIFAIWLEQISAMIVACFITLILALISVGGVLLPFLDWLYGGIDLRFPDATTYGTMLVAAVYTSASTIQFAKWISHLQTQNLKRDAVPRCGKCRYDLRGTLMAGIQRCPECGSPVDTSAKLVDPSSNRD